MFQHDLGASRKFTKRLDRSSRRVLSLVMYLFIIYPDFAHLVISAVRDMKRKSGRFVCIPKHENNPRASLYFQEGWQVYLHTSAPSSLFSVGGQHTKCPLHVFISEINIYSRHIA